MNFNILGLPYEVPETMTVTLKNDAKTTYPELEGIYELSPELHQGKPQWKIRGGGPYAIRFYTSTDYWYVVESGIPPRLYTKGQKNLNLLPDDTTYKWHYVVGGAETAPGDVTIRGTL